ncbi:MAG: methyltransferase domain-containing protein [Phycisphaerae bacterium]|nr:methyltransferase domain-containing protein [Phycisphaerae bacterium]
MITRCTKRSGRRSFFDETARHWEEQYDDKGLRGDVVLKRMDLSHSAITAQGLPAESIVLDLGCGPGIIADRIAESGLRVCAVDFSHMLAVRARQRLVERRRQGAYVIQADAHDLPFRDGAFAGSLCIALVSWVNDPQRVLAEVSRILMPGATAVLTVRNLFYCGSLTDPLFWLGLIAPEGVKARLRGGKGRSTPSDEVMPMLFRIGRFNRMLRRAGLRVMDWRTLQYGDFRVFRRSVLPRRWQLATNRLCERLWRWPVIRRLGWTYYVEVAKPGPAG